MEDIYSKILTEIIRQQEQIIGPIAVEKANSVLGVRVNWVDKSVTIDRNPIDAVEEVVEAYRELFGQISVEVCREAAAPFTNNLPAEQLPASLR